MPEPSLRLNKAITMLGIQASGLYSGLLLEGALGALAHSSHDEYREALFEKQRAEGLKAYLDMRDGPFQPEPMGPRSAKGRRARQAEEGGGGKTKTQAANGGDRCATHLDRDDVETTCARLRDVLLRRAARPPRFLRALGSAGLAATIAGSHRAPAAEPPVTM